MSRCGIEEMIKVFIFFLDSNMIKRYALIKVRDKPKPLNNLGRLQNEHNKIKTSKLLPDM